MKAVVHAVTTALVEPDTIKTNAIAIGSVALSSLSQIDVLIQVAILVASLVYTVSKATRAVVATVRFLRTPQKPPRIKRRRARR